MRTVFHRVPQQVMSARPLRPDFVVETVPPLGGPFTPYGDKSNLQRTWSRMVNDAGIPEITRHDLRQTGIARALLDNYATDCRATAGRARKCRDDAEILRPD